MSPRGRSKWSVPPVDGLRPDFCKLDAWRTWRLASCSPISAKQATATKAIVRMRLFISRALRRRCGRRRVHRCSRRSETEKRVLVRKRVHRVERRLIRGLEQSLAKERKRSRKDGAFVERRELCDRRLEPQETTRAPLVDGHLGPVDADEVRGFHVPADESCRSSEHRQEDEDE